MAKYDSIIVGSGMSGMTMALLLAQSGHKTLLLEKNSYIGGSIARFRRKNIHFDTGFHFVGGLQEGGIFNKVLTILGMEDLIEPISLPANKWIFERENKEFIIPYGVEGMAQSLKSYFPGESKAIEKYLGMVRHVCDNTPAMNLGDMENLHSQLKEDSVSLDHVLKNLTDDSLLEGLLASYAMCYGVKPSEISFANHARMCLNFYEFTSTVKGGGDAFIEAFKKKFEEAGVEVRCNAYINELAEIKDGVVKRFVLSSGEEVIADNCIFTIHPFEILKLLPQKSVSKAFRNRIMSFEPSVGFFSVFAALTGKADESKNDCGVTSIFPHCDINMLLDPENKGDGAIAIVKSPEGADGSCPTPIHFLQPSFPDETSMWQGSRKGKRPREYLKYKMAKRDHILERYFRYFPEQKERLKVIDTASLLTFIDYLNNSDGCAYGVKQKMGQYNLFGKLPLRNLFVAGQSSILPGVLGAAMSSLIVARGVIGKEKYGKLSGVASGKQ